MDIEDAVRDVIDALDGLTVPYMLVGSFSSNYYGVGRMTKDADFVVELGDHSILDIGRLLIPRFRVEPQMSFETVTMSRTLSALPSKSSSSCSTMTLIIRSGSGGGGR